MDLKIGRSAVKRWSVLSVVLTFNSRLTLNSVLEILTETLTTCSTVLNPWVQNKVQQIIRATIFTFRLFCVVIVHRSCLNYFWISKCLISFAWVLLAFNVAFTGTLIQVPAEQGVSRRPGLPHQQKTLVLLTG